MNIEAIYNLISEDRDAVDKVIRERLHSEVVLINQISHYIIGSGGKRLRPVLILLIANALGYKGRDHHELAAVIEFIHTATLLHDDVVDGSDLRRGKETANNVFGNEAAVLVGDFLYSRSFQMMVTVQNMKVMEILAEATNTIAEGEVQQLLNINNADLDEAGYLEVIRSKTAKLFESSAQLGAVLTGQNSDIESAMAAYGLHLGIAFQLVDDALDYTGDAEELGKNLGDDLAEGKPTLPLIYLIHNGNPEQAELIRDAINNGRGDLLDAVSAAIKSSDAIEYTLKAAELEVEKAIATLDCLPDSDYKEALIGLAQFSIERNH